MTRRRWLVVIMPTLLLIVAVVLAGCAPAAPPAPTQAPAPTKAPAATSAAPAATTAAPAAPTAAPVAAKKDLGKKKIAFIPHILAAEGNKRPADEIIAAGKVLGWEVTVYDPQGDLSRIPTIADNLIAQKVDGIVMNWVQASWLGPAYDKAKAAGIQIASIDAGATPDLPNDISIDPKLAGPEMARGLAKAMGGKGTAVALVYSPGAFAKAMWDYSKATFDKEFPDIKFAMVREHHVENIEQDVAQFVETAVQSVPDLSGCWCLAGPEVTPAAKMFEAKGKKNIAMVSFNGDSSEVDLIRQGYNEQTLSIPQEQLAWMIIDHLASVWAGTGPKIVTPPHLLVTKDNLPAGKYYEGEPGFRDKYKQQWAAKYVLPAQ